MEYIKKEITERIKKYIEDYMYLISSHSLHKLQSRVLINEILEKYEKDKESVTVDDISKLSISRQYEAGLILEINRYRLLILKLSDMCEKLNVELCLNEKENEVEKAIRNDSLSDVVFHIRKDSPIEFKDPDICEAISLRVSKSFSNDFRDAVIIQLINEKKQTSRTTQHKQ